MDDPTFEYDDFEEERSSDRRLERRKNTWKKIQRNYRISVKGEARKGGGLGKNRDTQPHRLYKGPNWDNRGGYAYNTENLGPSSRDKRTARNCEEQMYEIDERIFEEGEEA